MGHLVFERPVLPECFAINIRNNLTNIAKQLHELNAMLDGSSLPEYEPELESELDTVVEEFEFLPPPPPAAVSQSADEARDFQLPVLTLPELPSEGFGENAPEMNRLEVGLFETVNIEDNENLPVRDIMAELSRFSLPPGQTPPELEHDQTAFPNLSPPRSHEGLRTTF